MKTGETIWSEAIEKEKSNGRLVQTDNVIITKLESLERENHLLRMFHANTIVALETLAKAMESENFDKEWWAIKTKQLIGNAKNIIK